MSVSVVHDSLAPPPSSSGGVPWWRSSVLFSIRVDQNDQQVALAGVLRPFVADQMKPIRATLESAAKNAWGEMQLDFKRLKYMNNVAFLEINRFVRWAAEERPNLKIKLIISSLIPWAIRKFQLVAEIYSNVSIEIYDSTLYPIQQVLDDEHIIEVLRLQERLVWEREQKFLRQHGLKPRMRIADIAFGLGDFAILLQKSLKPKYVVGVRQSKTALRYAQQQVQQLGLKNVEYQYGDPTALLLPDASFDFVSCRLSLQLFHEPEQIMSELYRICKPGGRVYITSEMMSCIAGYPEYESIHWTYHEVAQQARKVGMDVDIGVRTRDLLVSAGLDDLKVDVIDVNTMNTDPGEFARVVESWTEFIDRVASRAGAGPEVWEKLRAGHRDHLNAITSSHGFASWPIYAGSGRKPVKALGYKE